MNAIAHYQDWFNGFGTGKYVPGLNSVVLDAALGKPHYSRVVVTHIEHVGNLDPSLPTVLGSPSATWPSKNHPKLLVSRDISMDGTKEHDLKRLIQRHLTLTHEFVHRRLTMDTSYGAMVRFFGLAKGFLIENGPRLTSIEQNLLSLLASKFNFLMENWRFLQEYIAGYCTWIELHELLYAALSEEPLSGCTCTKQLFEECIGPVNSFSREDLVSYLLEFKDRIKGMEYLKSNPMTQIAYPLEDHKALRKALVFAKRDYTKMYIASFLASSPTLSRLEFVLCPLESLAEHLNNNLPVNRIARLLRDYETLPAPALFAYSAPFIFQQELEVSVPRGFIEAISRSEFFQNKACKENFQGQINELVECENLEFCQFVRERFSLMDIDSYLSPMPRFDDDMQTEEVVFTRTGDHLDSLASALGSSGKTKGVILEQVNDTDPIQYQKIDFDYSIDMTYYAGMSLKRYEESPNKPGFGLPIPLSTPLAFGPVIYGGHDVPSLINILINN